MCQDLERCVERLEQRSSERRATEREGEDCWGNRGGYLSCTIEEDIFLHMYVVLTIVLNLHLKCVLRASSLC
jgi:hypothetical protein